MPIPIQEFLERSATRHRHLCPRQVLGVRMGMLAARLLPIEQPQTGKRLLTIVESDGCFSDGIEVTTGCSLGHRTLRVEDYGKIAAAFVDTCSEAAFRIAVRPGVREAASRFAPSGRSRWERQLLGYQKMPDEGLFSVTPVKLRIPARILISRPGVRIECEVCGEEVINEREVARDGAVLCQACAGQAYYLIPAGRLLEIRELAAG
ncbi:MAG: TraR/DksA C4-type zinc finger protein [Chloroflexi bacterium]|nr:TraR/DksA C4-type zinc finger protein [Chloroflexota bacterium]